MMRLGLDFYKTITACPRVYKKLAQAVLDGGGEVHIITAVKQKNVQKVQGEIFALDFPHTEIHIVIFENYDDIPALKAEVCGRLDLDMLIDDMKETIEFVQHSGVLGVLSLGVTVK